MSRPGPFAIWTLTAMLLTACTSGVAEAQSYQFIQRGPGYFGVPVQPSPWSAPNSPWYGGGPGYGNQFYGNQYGFGGGESFEQRGPSLESLDHGPRQALKLGCMERYGKYSYRYEACVNGERHSDDALAEGCVSRYQGNPRACLQTLKP